MCQFWSLSFTTIYVLINQPYFFLPSLPFLVFQVDISPLSISVHFSQPLLTTRVGTLIVATIYLQLIQNRYMFRSFTVLQCSHQHCVQPVVSDVEVVGYL